MALRVFSGAASPHSAESRVESTGPAVNVPDDGELTVIEDSATHVVEIIGDRSSVVHVVEQIAVDPRTFGLGLGDLSDVDTQGSPSGAGLVLHRDPVTGVYQLRTLEQQAAQGVGFKHVQFVATTLWQIPHEMGFEPAGVTVVDNTGTPTEYDEITYPLPGLIELRFGVPVAGTARLS
jgi:hypothetical protein